MSEDKIVEEITELVEEAKKPGVFNIVNALKERAYPHDDVVVYLDEQSAYEASVLTERIEELNKEVLILATPELQEELDTLTRQRKILLDSIESSKYIFKIVGVSEGKRDELMKKAAKRFPIEYKEDKNPFSGEVTRTELENDERDRYFTNLIWQAHIAKITDPEGNLQEGVSLDDVAVLRDALPIASQGKINQAVEKIRNATALFLYSVDEDFLAKP